MCIFDSEFSMLLLFTYICISEWLLAHCIFSCISVSRDPPNKKKKKEPQQQKPKQTKNENPTKLSGNCNNTIHPQYQITENCRTTEFTLAHASSKTYESIVHSVELLR